MKSMTLTGLSPVPFNLISNNWAWLTPSFPLEGSEPLQPQALSEAQQQGVLALARAILAERFARGEALITTAKSREYLRMALAPYPYEVFAVVFLDNQHRVIAFEEMFRGTIDGITVHAREIARSALEHNASAVILAHNHPAGRVDPSRADLALTERLRRSLALIEVRVLDHFIVGETVFSFAENGLLNVNE
ncbi:JAB domain-containing protein [Endothiovibrio diazotrophicus]